MWGAQRRSLERTQTEEVHAPKDESRVLRATMHPVASRDKFLTRAEQ